MTEATWISLPDLLANYRPGAAPWSRSRQTWDDEAADIDSCICACCGQPGHYQQRLEDWLREVGHVPGQGICLSSDGRVWDGHHRIVAAIRLGFPGLPVEAS